MSQQKIWKMSALASGQSEKWIRQQYNAAIKAANDRIKTITKPTYSGRAQAYEYSVKGDLAGAPYVKQRGGATVFKALPKGTDRETSLEALRMVERFLGAKTSTVAGIKETSKKRIGILNKMLEDDFKNRFKKSEGAPKLNKTDAENILQWMGSPEGKDAKADYDSNQVREGVAKAVLAQNKAAQEAAENDEIFNFKTVKELYKAFEKSQKSLADWIRESENQIGYEGF